VLFRKGSEGEPGHALLMVGWPEAAWHLELVGDATGETRADLTGEDLLVLYLDGPIEEDVIDRLEGAGGRLSPREIPTGTAGESPSKTQTDIAWFSALAIGRNDKRQLSFPAQALRHTSPSRAAAQRG
jgi:hypothetical protein